jgi:hypothetical protein
LTFILLIVGDRPGILDELLRPHPINLLNILLVIISYMIKFFNLKNEDLPNQSWE